ncbi:MAG TPA: geranylgeranyl reductase family protein [archaeon]|nr:geranylgeranyl reductase family protein [archaeon]
MANQYDVIIVGAGPAGSIAAMYLARAGVKALLIDKAEFPRDKICGDAQGRKAAKILKELEIYHEYEKLEGQKVYGITLSSPNGKVVNLDSGDRNSPAPGYVHKRMIFDNFLFSEAKKCVDFKAFDVKDLVIEGGFVRGVIGLNGNKEQETIRANIVLGADGANSIVGGKLGLTKNPLDHLLVAVRAYYRGVTGMSDRIEIHMIDHLIPGYFWIFPLPNGEANVGLGMVIKDMNAKKVNIKEALLKEIKVNPLFVDRFKDSAIVGEVKGWNLPAASYRRKCYGNGFLLLGDAASLIDPLSGEGVGNAMISGRIAATVVAEAMKKGDFSEKFLKKYDDELWATIGEEVEADYKLQKLGKQFPFLIDKIVERALKDPKFKKKMEELLPFAGGKKEIGEDHFVEDLKNAKF